MKKIAILSVVSLFTFAACSSASHDRDEESVGSASIAITSVPSDVGCIRIDAQGARSTVRDFDVAPGNSSVLQLASLAVGTVSFRGYAFAGACASVLPTTVAGWISEPVLANVSTSSTVSVTLAMKRNGKASVNVDFQDDDAGAAPEAGTLCTSNAQCPAGMPCVGGVCTSQKVLGAACSASTECLSAFCADGVCCNSVCTGACVACNQTGTLGSCTAAPPVAGETCGGWSLGPVMPRASSGHAQLTLNDGRVFVHGSPSDTRPMLFDGTSWTFGPAEPVPGARTDPEALLLPNGRVLVVGGRFGTTLAGPTTVFDATTMTWTAGPSMPVLVTNSAKVVLPSGKVALFGGYDASDAPVMTVQIYDPVGNFWSMGPSTLFPRADATATLLPNGRVLLAGGPGDGLRLAGQTSELFDPSSFTLTAGPSMAVGRYQHGAALLPNGRVLVFGGVGANRSSEIYDAVTNTWTGAGNMSRGRRAATSALVGGKVLAVGGYDFSTGGGNALGFTESFDPATSSWTEGPSLVVQRARHGMSIAYGRVLVTGGHLGGGPLASTEQL